MRIIYKSIGLGVLLLVAFATLSTHAYADTFMNWVQPFVQHGNYWTTDSLSQNFSWSPHYDAVCTYINSASTGAYEIYYSLNGGTYKTYSSDHLGISNRIDWTSGQDPAQICTQFGFEALQKPDPHGSLLITQDDLKIKILADNTNSITFGQSNLVILPSLDYLFPAVESVPDCLDTDLLCKGGRLLQTLFVPKVSDIKTDVSTLRETMEEKVPFAYILGVLDLGNDLSASNGATLTTLDIPYSSASVSATYGVPESISGTLPSFAIDYINVLKTAISFVIWAIFVIYLLVRFRHKIL